MNIMKEWADIQENTGQVIWKQEYMLNGSVYKVDGYHVIIDPSETEVAIAEVLANKYGKKVELIPRVLLPQKIQTPDYLIDGVRYDLKSPTGNGKDVFRDMIKKKRKQSPNFIFDVTNCPLSDEEIERQVQGIFAAQNTKFVQQVVLVRNDIVIGAYQRK